MSDRLTVIGCGQAGRCQAERSIDTSERVKPWGFVDNASSGKNLALRSALGSSEVIAVMNLKILLMHDLYNGETRNLKSNTIYLPTSRGPSRREKEKGEEGVGRVVM
jgi:hypothetical protein